MLKTKTVDDAMMESNYINVNAEFNEIVTDKLYFEEKKHALSSRNTYQKIRQDCETWKKIFPPYRSKQRFSKPFLDPLPIHFISWLTIIKRR